VILHPLFRRLLFLRQEKFVERTVDLGKFAQTLVVDKADRLQGPLQHLHFAHVAMKAREVDEISCGITHAFGFAGGANPLHGRVQLIGRATVVRLQHLLDLAQFGLENQGALQLLGRDDGAVVAQDGNGFIGGHHKVHDPGLLQRLHPGGGDGPLRPGTRRLIGKPAEHEHLGVLRHIEQLFGLHIAAGHAEVLQETLGNHNHVIEKVGITIEASEQGVMLSPDEWILAGIREQQAVGENLVAGGLALAEQGVPGAGDRLPLHLIHGGQDIVGDRSQDLAFVDLEAHEAVAQHHLMQFEAAFVAFLQVLAAEIEHAGELPSQFVAEEFDQAHAAEQIQLHVVGFAGPAQRCDLQFAQILLEFCRVIVFRLGQGIVLDVGASVGRFAKWILLRHPGQLLHVAMLLNEIGQMDTRDGGKPGAEKNVWTEIVNAGNESLEGKLRDIVGQRKLARHLAHFCPSEQRQRRHWVLASL